VRVHVSVVEWASQDCHGAGTDVAAVDGAFVIAALPSGDNADNQPDDKQYRSNVHLDLRQHRRLKADGSTLIAIREEAYP
jgi:hypothetical protein